MREQENLILRAWDKKSRKMREVDSIAFHNSRSVGDYRSSRLPKVVNLWGFNVITQQDVVIYRDIKDKKIDSTPFMPDSYKKFERQIQNKEGKQA